MFRSLTSVLCTFSLFVTILSAQTKVTLKIDTKAEGPVIPKDFLGLSFETAAMRLGHKGINGYFFDSSNTQAVTLFKTLGLKNLRVGGATVDNPEVIPTRESIDALFGFVKAAGLSVIYSFKLPNGDMKLNASDAKYIREHYWQYIKCFSIGNEPDWHSFHIKDPNIYETTDGVPGTGFPSYMAQWNKFAKAILDSVPDAKFGNPNTGSNFPVSGSRDTYYNGKSWTVNFAESVKSSGIVTMIFLHNYVGQSASGTPKEMTDKMLSPEWPRVQYQALYNESCVPVMKLGFPYRLTESNSFSGEVSGASNSFATSLFALDYLRWWAEHSAKGVNFHNKQWIYNNTITRDRDGNYQVYPMAYGIKAFDVSGYGEVKPVEISNPDSLNLTAYAVKNEDAIYVTIINKEHGSSQKQATVEITLPEGKISNASVMRLVCESGEATATVGVTLGGATIKNSGSFEGKWTKLDSNKSRNLTVTVPATSAAIVRISY